MLVTVFSPGSSQENLYCALRLDSIQVLQSSLSSELELYACRKPKKNYFTVFLDNCAI